MDLAGITACLLLFAFTSGLVGYRIGKEDGRIEERKALYWRTRRTDRQRLP